MSMMHGVTPDAAITIWGAWHGLGIEALRVSTTLVLALIGVLDLCGVADVVGVGLTLFDTDILQVPA